METIRIRLHTVNRFGNPYGEIPVARLFYFMLMREWETPPHCCCNTIYTPFDRKILYFSSIYIFLFVRTRIQYKYNIIYYIYIYVHAVRCACVEVKFLCQTDGQSRFIEYTYFKCVWVRVCVLYLCASVN